MEYLKLFFAYLFPLIIGFVAISLVEKKGTGIGLGEKMALSFILGTGLISLYIFYLGFLGIKFALAGIIALPIVVLPAGIIVLTRRGWKSCFSSGPRRPFRATGAVGKLIVILIGTLLIWKIAFISFLILSKPTYFDDSVANYNFKAKVFYHHRSLVLESEHPDFLGGYMPWKSLGIPLFKTWVTICLGKWKEYAVNLNTLFVFLALGLISYYNLIRIVSPLAGLVFTYIILSIPLLTFHAGFAYVDMIVGCYFFSGIVYLIRWVREHDRRAFFISALLFGTGLATKDDMIAIFVGGVLPVLILYQLIARLNLKSTLRTTIPYLFIIIILNLPWFVIKKNYDLAVGLPAEYRKFEFHPEAFGILASYLFDSGNYNILWTVFFCTLIFSSRLIARTELKYVLISLAGAIAVTFSLFIFTSVFEWLRGGMTINRAVLSFVPVLIWYMALFYRKATEKTQDAFLKE